MASILVIDDEPNVRKMVRLALAKAGHEVTAAEDGLQGLEVFGDGTRWDLTLVDERMPGMAGREVIAEARRRDPQARMVMITSFDTVQLAAEVLQAGAIDFLRKPFTTVMLRGAVDAALSRRRRPSPPPAEAILPPAEEGASPAVFNWLNGYRYWPTDLPAPSEARLPHGLEIRRAFEVLGPLGQRSACVVGVTPHVRQQVNAALEPDPPAEDIVWDTVCMATLTAYLWKEAEAPPPVLPIYELAHEEIQAALDTSRRIAAGRRQQGV